MNSLNLNIDLETPQGRNIFRAIAASLSTDIASSAPNVLKTQTAAVKENTPAPTNTASVGHISLEMLADKVKALMAAKKGASAKAVMDSHGVAKISEIDVANVTQDFLAGIMRDLNNIA